MSMEHAGLESGAPAGKKTARILPAGPNLDVVDPRRNGYGIDESRMTAAVRWKRTRRLRWRRHRKAGDDGGEREHSVLNGPPEDGQAVRRDDRLSGFCSGSRFGGF